MSDAKVPSLALCFISLFVSFSRFTFPLCSPLYLTDLIDAGMDALSPEILLHVFSYLDTHTLLRLQVTSKRLNASSANELYRNVIIDDLTSDNLRQTLLSQPDLRKNIKSLKIQRDIRMPFPRDTVRASRTVMPISTLCAASLQSLSIDVVDMEDIKSLGLFEALQGMPSIIALDIKGGPASIAFADLHPSLSLWSPRLKSLQLVGLHAGDATKRLSALNLIQLKTFKAIDSFELEDWQLEALLGSTGKLSTLAMHLLVSESPRLQIVLDIIESNGNVLNDIEILQPYQDRHGGDLTFGLKMINACQPGRLRMLNLSGQIFNKQIFNSPVLSRLSALYLSWVSSINFRDVRTWLQGARPTELQFLVASKSGSL